MEPPSSVAGATLAARLGHTDAALANRRYVKASPAELASPWEALDRLRRKERPAKGPDQG